MSTRCRRRTEDARPICRSSTWPPAHTNPSALSWWRTRSTAICTTILWTVPSGIPTCVWWRASGSSDWAPFCFISYPLLSWIWSRKLEAAGLCKHIILAHLFPSSLHDFNWLSAWFVCTRTFGTHWILWKSSSSPSGTLTASVYWRYRRPWT